ncbi:VanZ family protein [Brachybacterium sp. JHP9]|uniref:VanZ family protein n=1 Tax=Brachybacterium equifaecis TaxID=2910770 RepID=A0ABT0R1T3_9MICO|nr:VanZ family protein [Brachybacterium equifaecis]MCL6423898.1 VanZ family protein [Brachybacterium equifaecis]
MSAIELSAQELGRQIREIGGRPLARIALLGIAIALNSGFYLSSAPDAGAVSEIQGIDKLVHVGVFALTVWAAGRLLAPLRRFPMGWVVLGALAHAVLIEVLQATLLPHRSGDAADVLADSIGIIIGIALWWAERRADALRGGSRRRRPPGSPR